MPESFVLASDSPQRRKLLGQLGFPFKVYPSKLLESEIEESDPFLRAQILAQLKARDVNEQFPESYVLGADTLVVSQEGELLEKPQDESEAREMLRKQSGSVSTVHSGISLIDPSQEERSGVSSSSVFFKELTDDEIDWWISTGQWQGRSGSFEIEGPGQLIIKKIEGDWPGVVGLPIHLLSQLLKEAGFPLR